MSRLQPENNSKVSKSLLNTYMYANVQRISVMSMIKKTKEYFSSTLEIERSLSPRHVPISYHWLCCQHQLFELCSHIGGSSDNPLVKRFGVNITYRCIIVFTFQLLVRLKKPRVSVLGPPNNKTVAAARAESQIPPPFRIFATRTLDRANKSKVISVISAVPIRSWKINKILGTCNLVYI